MKTAIRFTNNSDFAADVRLLLDSVLTRSVVRKTYGGSEYETTVRLPKTGSPSMYISAAVFLIALVCFYFGAQLSASPPWLQWFSWIMLGFVIPGIGFNIMHDAGHKSFSSRQWANDLFSFSGNLVGIHVGFWKVKHNIVHHTFTNIVGIDDDIDLYPFIRVDKSQKLRWFHRLQFLYAIPLYALYLLFWIYILDFIRYFKGTIGNYPIEARYRNFWVFFGTKIFHVLVFPVLAYKVHGWSGVFGYLTCMGIGGVVLTFVFQCAHMVSTVQLLSSSSMPANPDRFTHQVLTTANFAPNSTVLAWYVGGLNKQIEHHLFPGIAHVHYKALSDGLRKLCAKHKLPYFEFPNFVSAIFSHLVFLKNMGKV